MMHDAAEGLRLSMRDPENWKLGKRSLSGSLHYIFRDLDIGKIVIEYDADEYTAGFRYADRFDSDRRFFVDARIDVHGDDPNDALRMLLSFVHRVGECMESKLVGREFLRDVSCLMMSSGRITTCRDVCVLAVAHSHTMESGGGGLPRVLIRRGLAWTRLGAERLVRLHYWRRVDRIRAYHELRELCARLFGGPR